MCEKVAGLNSLIEDQFALKYRIIIFFYYLLLFINYYFYYYYYYSIRYQTVVRLNKLMED